MSDHHACPYPGCWFPVNDERLACPAHWAILPADLRRRIGRARHNRRWEELGLATTEASAHFRAAGRTEGEGDA